MTAIVYHQNKLITDGRIVICRGEEIEIQEQLGKGRGLYVDSRLVAIYAISQNNWADEEFLLADKLILVKLLMSFAQQNNKRLPNELIQEEDPLFKSRFGTTVHQHLSQQEPFVCDDENNFVGMTRNEIFWGHLKLRIDRVLTKDNKDEAKIIFLLTNPNSAYRDQNAQCGTGGKLSRVLLNMGKSDREIMRHVHRIESSVSPNTYIYHQSQIQSLEEVFV